MSNSEGKSTNTSTLPTELKAEQALGLIGLGLIQKMGPDGIAGWDWALEGNSEKTDLIELRQRLELTSLAIETGAPLSTSEVSLLLGARPGSAKAERGGLIARRLSRNVWKLSKAEKDSSYWRN